MLATILNMRAIMLLVVIGAIVGLTIFHAKPGPSITGWLISVGLMLWLGLLTHDQQIAKRNHRR